MRIWVPAFLLLHRELSPAAKLLWICCQIGSDPRPRQLEARSTLTRHTVLRGLAELKSSGWLSISGQGGPQAALPAPLLADPRLEPRHKLLYGILQLTSCQSTYAKLSILSGFGLNTVKRAITALRQTGWLEATQVHQQSPIHFTLCNPVAEQQQKAVADLDERLTRAAFKGEALMREYLSLLVDSGDYEDNASPGYLINPLTGRELQLDRYYPPGVAFEFNGAQHYGPTAKYPGKTPSKRQMARDLMKKGLCADREIHLIILHPQDLTLDRIRAKLDGLLPLRNLDGQERIIQYLAAASRRYRRKACRSA